MVIKKLSINHLFMALAVYFLIVLVLVFWCRFQIDIDGTSYLSIAKKYLAGDYLNAINGCWSPLFSWLMVPFMAMGVDAQVSAKIITIVFGAISIIGLWTLSFRFDISDRFRDLLLLAFIPLVAYWSLRLIAPDLIALDLVLFYFYIMFDLDCYKSIKFGLVVGLLGGFAYLAKAYNFPFFVISFFLFNLFYFLRYFRERENILKIVRNFITGMLVFLLVSSCWVFCVSQKYGSLSISTVGKINMNVMVNPESKDQPMYYQGFLCPANQTAVSAWEDPTLMKSEPWDPKTKFDYVSGLFKAVARHFLEFLKIFGIHLLYLLLGLWLLVLSGFGYKKIFSQSIVFAFLSAGLYLSGYLLLHVEDRYIWVVHLLLMLVVADWLSKIFGRNDFLSLSLAAKASVVFLFLFLAKDFYTGIRHLYLLRNHCQQQNDLFILSQNLFRKYMIQSHSRVGCYVNTEKVGYNVRFMQKRWETCLHLSYYLNLKYYGVSRPNENIEELKKILK